VTLLLLMNDKELLPTSTTTIKNDSKDCFLLLLEEDNNVFQMSSVEHVLLHSCVVAYGVCLLFNYWREERESLFVAPPL
jgi:hypothetical protein